MSKIKFDKISDSEVKVTLSESTPLEMVDALVKSLTDKGLNEDMSKSTLTTRYFFKDKTMDVADNLLKALEEVAKAKKLPWWASHQHEVDQWKNKNAALDRQAKVKTNIGPSAPKTTSTTPSAPVTPMKPTTLHNPETSGHVDYYNRDRIKKEEDSKKKKVWAQHNQIPTGQPKLSKNDDTATEEVLAQQLANLMSGKAMLGQENRQPTSEDFIMAGEAMGLGVPEQEVKKSDNKWDNTMNDWLKEATKPISQRFASEEEEAAYWSNIKIADKDRGEPGY